MFDQAVNPKVTYRRDTDSDDLSRNLNALQNNTSNGTYKTSFVVLRNPNQTL